MRKFWQWLLLAVTGITLMILSPPIIGQAREITTVTGLDANSCVIKDEQGNVYSHTATLSPKVHYILNYHWAIPNNESIKSGDTMHFYVPDNVTIVGDRSFPMVGTGGIGTLGTGTIDSGSRVGLITLNSYLEFGLGRSGWLRLNIYPVTTPPTTPTPAPEKPIAMTKSASWAEPDNFTKINWQLAVNANGNTLVNPVIVDQLSANQTFVPNSTVVKSATGQDLPSATVVNGTRITFQIRTTVVGNFTLSYQTTPNNPTQATTRTGARSEDFENVATYSDDNGHDASANAEITRDDETLEPDEDLNPGTEEPEQPNTEEPGTEPPAQTNPIAMTKAASWADPNDLTKINWDLNVTANGNQLVNPEIIDRLSPNQSYLAGSAKVFDSTGQAVPVSVDYVGTEVTFNVKGTYLDHLRVTYQTTTDSPSGGETFDNAAVYQDDAGNRAQATAKIEREGEPEAPDVPGQTDPIAMTKTAAWTDPNDFTKINWGLNVIANGNKLVNPVIIDEFTNNQSFIDGSVKAVTASGTEIPVTASLKGDELTFKLTGTFSENLQITYQTRTASPTGAAIFDNAAIYQDDADNNADAEATIDRDEAVIEPEDPGRETIGMTKSAAWAAPNKFTHINWTIAIVANGNQLVNPKITDLISQDLTYVDGSAKAIDSVGTVIPVTATVRGNEIVFRLAGTFTKDFTLTYQTKTITASGAATYANAAIYEDDNGNGGCASATIDRPDEEQQPAPEKPNVEGPDDSGSTETEPEHGNSGQSTAPAKQPAVTGSNPAGAVTPAAITTPSSQPTPSMTPTATDQSPAKATLPQTNDHINRGLGLLGLVGLIFLILIGVGIHRRAEH
ncbi:Ig-like domain-containing protein [Lactiplantibacillus nangangensis]|uniref:Ig-like domain-containing protein n=1 Tax=Lactiplantibacillus nangangensis TaxID=2559917 RepID=A0ABW1SLG7_9LACO|nr:Ig-like domain-containing protein [Lactiplantibacillus nangangensis]